jgi:hypothetical protein
MQRLRKLGIPPTSELMDALCLLHRCVLSGAVRAGEGEGANAQAREAGGRGV